MCLICISIYWCSVLEQGRRDPDKKIAWRSPWAIYSSILWLWSLFLWCWHRNKEYEGPSIYFLPNISNSFFGLLALLETLIQTPPHPPPTIILSSCPSQLPAFPLGSLEWILGQVNFPKPDMSKPGIATKLQPCRVYCMYSGSQPLSHTDHCSQAESAVSAWAGLMWPLSPP